MFYQQTLSRTPVLSVATIHRMQLEGAKSEGNAVGDPTVTCASKAAELQPQSLGAIQPRSMAYVKQEIWFAAYTRTA